MNHPKKPCKGCPFSRCTTPGALGGSPADVYVGQIVGPFWLPCHSPTDYQGKASKPDEAPQCAGAAIFRHRINVSHMMPKFLLSLDDSSDTANEVFTSVEEFYQHHEGMSPSEARRAADPNRVSHLFAIEMSKTPVFRATLDGRVL